jgi:hypothetical protein
MDIQLQPLRQDKGALWSVRIDEFSVMFRSESEAREFTDRLQQRLSAPHPLPMEPPGQAFAGGENG